MNAGLPVYGDLHIPARLRRLSGVSADCSCGAGLGADHQQIGGAESRAGDVGCTYESGMGHWWGRIQFNIRYYMFALVFVIFDVETVFLYP